MLGWFQDAYADKYPELGFCYQQLGRGKINAGVVTGRSEFKLSKLSSSFFQCDVKFRTKTAIV